MTEWLDSFLNGVVAGYGIAVPVGPIAILILELGVRRGFRIAFSAGAGTATADLAYASVAVVAGSFLTAVLAPFALAVRIVSGLGLIAIGGWLLHRGRSMLGQDDKSRINAANCMHTYGVFLGLTLLNPVTVTYFTTLILGMQANANPSSQNGALFVFGAFLASLSWQSLIASIGGLTHKRLSRRVQAVTFVIGNLVVIALGVAILLGLRI